MIDVLKEAENIAIDAWKRIDQEQEDRKEFLEDLLDAVASEEKHDDWQIATVYECEVVAEIPTFVVVIWRVSGQAKSYTSVQLKAFLVQYDDEEECYMIASSRKI